MKKSGAREELKERKTCHDFKKHYNCETINHFKVNLGCSLGDAEYRHFRRRRHPERPHHAHRQERPLQVRLRGQNVAKYFPP